MLILISTHFIKYSAEENSGCAEVSAAAQSMEPEKEDGR